MRRISFATASSWVARGVLGWPKICELARAFPRGCSYEQLTLAALLAQLLGQLGAVLTPRVVLYARWSRLHPSIAIKPSTINQRQGVLHCHLA